jgi:hypothetical protein
LFWLALNLPIATAIGIVLILLQPAHLPLLEALSAMFCEPIMQTMVLSFGGI